MRDASQARASGQGAVLTVALCCLVAMMEGIDLQAPGLTLPVLGPLFKMSAGDKGWFLSISTFGLMIGAALGGRLSDRIGRKWVLIIAAGLFGLFSTATAFSTSAQMLLWARLLTGLGLGGALPNVIAIVAESVSLARRHTAVGFLYASLPAGGGLASLIVAMASGREQWPVVYLVGGVAPLLVIALLVFVLPNRKTASAGVGAPAAAPDAGVFVALFGEGRALRTLMLWTGFFTALLIMYLLLGWLPSLMVSRGLSRAEASTVQIAFNGFGALASVVTGILLDRGRRQITVVVVFALTAAALAFLAGAPGQFAISVLAGGLVGATISGTQTVLYALAPSCYPMAVRGTGVGFAVAVGRLGSAAGPILAAALVGAGHSPSQVLMALLPIIILSTVTSVATTLTGPKAALVVA
jgi:AAHS family 3-hydroxyphenylpropionic acid transporter